MSTRAILVLGMHRSGTSAVAGVLGLAGAHVGDADELLPAHETDNPRGYFERPALNALHDDLLSCTGHAWNRVAYHDASRIDVTSCGISLHKLKSLVESVGAGPLPWLAKDPRACLLMPEWNRLVPDAAYVVVVRDPREIAGSMIHGARGTFTSRFVIALWEKYLRAALAGLRGRQAVFVDYATLLQSPLEQSQRLVSALRARSVEGVVTPTSDQLAAFLSVHLNRSRTSITTLINDSQQQLYDWLTAQSQAPGNVSVEGFPDLPAPDAELAEFEAAFDYHLNHGKFLAADETNKQLRAIDARLADHSSERERWAAALETERHRADTAQIDAASQRTERHRAETEVIVLRSELESANRQSEHLAVELNRTEHARAQQHHDSEIALDRSRRHIEALEATVNALRSSLSWRLTAPLRWLGAPSRGVAQSEPFLYRLYYRMPGLSAARKRSLILWLHRRAPWLTRNTLSYKLYEQTQTLIRDREQSLHRRVNQQRMTEPRAREMISSISDPPLISIVMPVYNVDRRWLLAAVESVRRQFYPNWELCITDDASPREETQKTLQEIEAFGDSRIKIRRLDENLGIAGASNAALEIATGEFVGLLDNDDELTRDALLEVALRITSDNPDLIYSDEDKLDENGNNVEPYFKSDYSPDYLLCNNYICHFSVIRRQLFIEAGAFQPGFDGAQDFDLMLRVCERAKSVVHIPKILYHWRKIPGSTAATSAGKPYTHEAGRRAVAAALQRRAVAGESQSGPFPNTYRVRRDIGGEPLISILIPFRDKGSLLDKCLDSILAKTDYANFEIVGIDNGSVDRATHRLKDRMSQRDARVRFIQYDAPFNFSAINNFAVKHARGEHLVFLNNDTEVISGEWLRAMLEHSQRADVGVVGAKLLYADNTIQHAGVILGLGGMAGHSHLMSPAHHHGYFSRPQLIQNVSAVTFACAMTRKTVFEELHGLNETELAIAFNDVDYCLRAREAGYLIVYTPYAELYHHESKSRGYETDSSKRDRLARETAYMRQRHREIMEKGDPYYNPNLSLTNNFEPNPRYADELPL